jgi:hypothetical protein
VQERHVLGIGGADLEPVARALHQRAVVAGARRPGGPRARADQQHALQLGERGAQVRDLLPVERLGGDEDA